MATTMFAQLEASGRADTPNAPPGKRLVRRLSVGKRHEGGAPSMLHAAPGSQWPLASCAG